MEHIIKRLENLKGQAKILILKDGKRLNVEIEEIDTPKICVKCLSGKALHDIRIAQDNNLPTDFIVNNTHNHVVIKINDIAKIM